MESKKELAIIILIGGKSTRFGTEKAVVEVLGKPLILHQIETLATFDEDIYLVAHSEDQIYQYKKQIAFPKEIQFIIDNREIFDYPKIFKPIIGIYSGFKELHDLGFEKGFVLSCDMPLIQPEIVKLMINESKDCECCIPRWESGYLEPFFAVYPVKKGFERAKWILTTKNYGMPNFIDKTWDIRYISVENTIRKYDKNLLSFININGPIDIDKTMRYFQY